MKTHDSTKRDEHQRAYGLFQGRVDDILIDRGARPIASGEYALRTPVGAIRVTVEESVITCRFASPYGGRLAVTEGYDANAEVCRHSLPYYSDNDSWVVATANSFARQLDRVLSFQPSEVQRVNIEHDIARGCREAAKVAAFYVTCEKYKLLDAMKPNEVTATRAAAAVP